MSATPTFDPTATTQAMQRVGQQMAALGTSAREAAEALAAHPWARTEVWARVLFVGDGDPVPQIGDEELAAWQDFISETKQRSSRIVTR